MLAGWRLRCSVIFEADTVAGCRFDLWLIARIVLSALVVMVDSVQSLHSRFSGVFSILESCFPLLFTREYMARLVYSPQPLRYATSFFGVVDVVSVLPT